MSQAFEKDVLVRVHALGNLHRPSVSDRHHVVRTAGMLGKIICTANSDGWWLVQHHNSSDVGLYHESELTR